MFTGKVRTDGSRL